MTVVTIVAEVTVVTVVTIVIEVTVSHDSSDSSDKKNVFTKTQNNYFHHFCSLIFISQKPRKKITTFLY